jgi:hypothetical protein
MPPLGLALKQLVGPSPGGLIPGSIGGWFGPNATIVGAGGIWNGDGGNNLTSNGGAVTSIVAPPGFNGLNAVGPFNTPHPSGSVAPSVPHASIPLGSLDLSSPGNAATIYVVMALTDIGGVGEPNNPILGYGYDAFGGIQVRSQQFYAAFEPANAEFAGSPAFLILYDQDGPTPTGNSYRGLYPLPSSLASGSTGIMVLQTQRHAGHRFRWQRGDIGPFSDISVGTVGNFTGTDLFTLCGRYTENPVGSIAPQFWADAFIGHVYVFPVIHSDAQIVQMEAYLGGIWAV